MTPLLEYLVSAGGFALLSLAAVAWMVARPRSVAARRAGTRGHSPPAYCMFGAKYAAGVGLQRWPAEAIMVPS